MNAGSGVIHDGQLSIEFQKAGGTVYSFQFWINLPARREAEPPEYMPVESEELPLIELPDGAGTVRVLAGRLMGKMSRVPTYTEQFVYHVQLGRDRHAHLPTEAGLEYAGYLPSGSARIASVPIEARLFFLFGTEGSGIEIANDFKSVVDILIFGGEPYTEPVVSHGPFVMNTKEEITRAYADYREGNYGRIDYSVLDAN